MTETIATVYDKNGNETGKFTIPLEECPLCGSTPSMEIEYKGSRFYESIECADCHLVLYGQPNEHIAERWNKRKETIA